MRCAATGRRREGDARAAGKHNLHVPSAGGRGAGLRGTLGRLAWCEPLAGQGRDKGRASWTALGSLRGRAGPSSPCRAQANGAPSPPTRPAASPPRVAAGAGGRAGLAGWGGEVGGGTRIPISLPGVFLGITCGGRSQAPKKGAGEEAARRLG